MITGIPPFYCDNPVDMYFIYILFIYNNIQYKGW